MNDMVIFDQHTERYEKAWEAFNRLYVMEHPAPPAPRWYQGLPWLMIPFGVIALCGIALSALRTAPVFQQIAVPLVGETFALLEAALAVIVIEVAIVIMRYVLVLQRAEDGKLNTDDLRAWMVGGFWLAFGVAILANLYASIKHVPLVAPVAPLLDLVIALAVGLSAPMLAFIAGDILASLYLRSERRRADLRARYEAALSDWQTAREKSWNARKGDYGLRLRVDNLPAATASMSALSEPDGQRTDVDGRGHGYGVGYVKRTDAQDRVRAYLDSNPDAISLTVRELAATVGVGKTTVAEVVRQYKAGN